MDQAESPGGAGMKNSPGRWRERAINHLCSCRRDVLLARAVLMPTRMRGRESIQASGFSWVLRAAFYCLWNHLTMPLV